METEIWKDIPGYEGRYQVSNMGNIKSLKRKVGFLIRKEKILKPKNNGTGYLYVSFLFDGKYKNYTIHRLVASAFIPNLLNLPVVMHLDNNRSNNLVGNLMWGTTKENIQQCYREGRARNHLQLNHPMKGKFGINNSSSIAVDQYSLEGELIKTWGALKEIERELGFLHGNISNCCKGKYKQSYGYVWRYKNP